MKLSKFGLTLFILFSLESAFANGGITCYKKNPINGEMQRILTIANTFGPEGYMGSFLGVDRAGRQHVDKNLRDAISSQSGMGVFTFSIENGVTSNCGGAISPDLSFWRQVKTINGSKQYDGDLTFEFSIRAYVRKDGSQRGKISFAHSNGQKGKIEGLSCFVEEG